MVTPHISHQLKATVSPNNLKNEIHGNGFMKKRLQSNRLVWDKNPHTHTKASLFTQNFSSIKRIRGHIFSHKSFSQTEILYKISLHNKTYKQTGGARREMTPCLTGMMFR